MSFEISDLIQQMIAKKSIPFDASTVDDALAEMIPTLGVFEDKEFDATDDASKESLELEETETGTRIVKCVPALNLMRCSSFGNDLDWVDSFLFLISDVYKVLPVPDQFKLAKEFYNFTKKSKRFHTFFYTKVSQNASIVEKFPILDEESAAEFLNGDDTANIATLIAYVFKYALHIFSMNDDDFFDPQYISDLQYQDKKPTLFFILSASGHIEPLFQYTSTEFGAEFSWADPTLCQLKTICNQYIDPEYTLPADCNSVPSGVSLDTLDQWIRYTFSTRIVVNDEEPDSPEEQDVQNDSKQYPIPKLAEKIVSTRREKGVIKRIEVALPLQVAAQAKIVANGWYTAKTVGDGTCLIHSFLQCTSAFYRSIPNAERSLVGQWFRRAVLAPLYPDTDEDDKVHKERILNTSAWLEQFDVQKLANTFQINICIITTTNGLFNIFKPDDGFRGKPYIFILCSKEIHYSSIYLAAQEKFMLSEDEMRGVYSELVADMYNDEDYTTARRELVEFVRSTAADEATKQTVVENIFRHERPQSGQPDPVAPDKHARNLEGALNGYAATLGIPTTNFNAFRQRVRNTARGGRRTKMHKTLKARR